MTHIMCTLLICYNYNKFPSHNKNSSKKVKMFIKLFFKFISIQIKSFYLFKSVILFIILWA